MNKSPWMEGLLWAEEYIDKGVFQKVTLLE